MTKDELTAKFIEMSGKFMNQNNVIDPEKCYLNPADGLSTGRFSLGYNLSTCL
ncbi:MAG: hypothetical protein K2K89_13790 [Ruminococcus sp.]|nr:hypothetical protein [Ruminococcus sp.]